MENIARALGVEIKDQFEFAHLQAGGVKVEEIEQLLAGADGEKKRMIMRSCGRWCGDGSNTYRDSWLLKDLQDFKSRGGLV